MIRRRLLMLAGPAARLTGCASPLPSDCMAERPHLDLERCFDPPVQAHGIFTGRSGKVVRRFVVQISGGREDAQSLLDEHFTSSDGKTERRAWHIKEEGDGRDRGRADDGVGVARGQAAGNASNWRCTLRLPVDGRVVEEEFDDRMILVDERVMLNKARMSKLGFFLGDVTLAFVRR